MRTLSLRSRLTVWCVLVAAAVLACFAVDVVITQRRIGLRRIDQEIDATRLQLTNMLREELRELDTPQLAAQESRDVIASAARPVAILTGDGAVLATSFEAFSAVFPRDTTTPGISTVETRTGAWRVQVAHETLEGEALRLVVASPLSELARDQREVREAILLGIPVGLVLAAVGGLWLAAVGLRPITVMARRAASIPLTGADDLGSPLRDDELGQLTRAFNALVARLRAALHTQQQFMADASHELRNPVSVIRTASDVALSRDHRDEAEYRDALMMTGMQSRRLSALVEDMLILARADAGGYPLRPVDCFLDDVIDECRHAISVLAAERQVKIDAAGASDVAIHCDRELVGRLLVNLLQNAVQHTPPGGLVRVDVAVSASQVCIRVIDNGTGIAQQDRIRIFDRFVQIDPARRSEGAGLGLTIAKWIAEIHGGSLAVEASSPRGTTFCVVLPTSGRGIGVRPAVSPVNAMAASTSRRQLV